MPRWAWGECSAGTEDRDGARTADVHGCSGAAELEGGFVAAVEHGGNGALLAPGSHRAQHERLRLARGVDEQRGCALCR
eukprot:scaffold18912_cov96-Isochrysis_galbana.AAC.2